MLLARLQLSLLPMKRWAADHKGEIMWAALFALVFAWPVARLIDPPKPNPYKIYVVADHHTDADALSVFQPMAQASRAGTLRVGDVSVEVQLEILDDDESETSKKKAQELVKRGDTLLVIGHLPSQLTEASLPTYFGARPQVPVITTTASDDDLLVQCDQPSSRCFEHDKFAPLLQLSPTNRDQGMAAVTFATQNGKRRFLIVLDNDSTNRTYSNNMDLAYHDAVGKFNQEHPGNGGADGGRAHVVGTYRMESPLTKVALERWNPDCVLYAGGLGEARTLLNTVSDKPLMVILSDSSVEPGLSDEELAGFRPARPVRFTYQTDAADYNKHVNVYGQDAFSIAQQLVHDLNERGGDIRFWLKSLLHIHDAKDVRRILVQVMEQNSASHTWYEGKSGTPYIFKDHRRFNGMFHVWQLREPAAKTASHMLDVDGWHPPREIAASQGALRPTAHK